MTPIPIVEDFDAIKDIGTSQIAGFVNTLADPLFFQATEEGLGHSVKTMLRLSTVTAPIHAEFQVVGRTAINKASQARMREPYERGNKDNGRL